MMSSPAKTPEGPSSPAENAECPDCKKSFKDSFAVTRHVQSGRCPSVKTSAPRRRSGRSGEPEPEPDPTILQQDPELEELLSSSPCPFAQYVSPYLILNLYPINCLPSDTESVKSWRLSPSSAIRCFLTAASPKSCHVQLREQRNSWWGFWKLLHSTRWPSWLFQRKVSQTAVKLLWWVGCWWYAGKRSSWSW